MNHKITTHALQTDINRTHGSPRHTEHKEAPGREGNQQHQTPKTSTHPHCARRPDSTMHACIHACACHTLHTHPHGAKEVEGIGPFSGIAEPADEGQPPVHALLPLPLRKKRRKNLRKRYPQCASEPRLRWLLFRMCQKAVTSVVRCMLTYLLHW